MSGFVSKMVQGTLVTLVLGIGHGLNAKIQVLGLDTSSLALIPQVFGLGLVLCSSPWPWPL